MLTQLNSQWKPNFRQIILKLKSRLDKNYLNFSNFLFTLPILTCKSIYRTGIKFDRQDTARKTPYLEVAI